MEASDEERERGKPRRYDIEAEGQLPMEDPATRLPAALPINGYRRSGDEPLHYQLLFQPTAELHCGIPVSMVS